MGRESVWSQEMRITRPIRENILRLLYRDEEFSNRELEELVGLRKAPDDYHLPQLEKWDLVEVDRHRMDTMEKVYTLTTEGRKLVEQSVIENG